MKDRLRRFSRALRRDATSAERRLWSLLRNRRLAGRKFRRQHPIDRFIVDFFCPEERLAIELDGAVHHDPARAEADTRRQRILESHGVRVVRFSNREVLATPDVVCAAIAAHFGPDTAD